MDHVTARTKKDMSPTRLGLYVAPGDRTDVTSPYRGRPAPRPSPVVKAPGEFTAFGVNLPADGYVVGLCEDGQRDRLVRSGCWIHFEATGRGQYLFVQRTGTIDGSR